MTNRPYNNNCPRPVAIPSSAYSQPAPCSTPITLGGDVIGYNYDNTVTKVQGIKWTPTNPVVGQIPIYTASGDIQWTTPTTFNTLTVANGSGLVLNGTELDINCASLISHCDLLTNTSANSTYLKLTGGTITGNLTVNGMTELASVSATGTVTFDALSGAGTRMVTVLPSGELAFDVLPSSVTTNYVNLGSGKKVFSNYDTNTDTVSFKTIIAGNLMEVVEGANTLTFNYTGPSEVTSVANIGSGVGVFKQMNLNEIQLYSLSAGQNMNIALNGNVIEFDAVNVGEVNTLSNSGTGVSNLNGANLVNPKVGTTLRIKGLLAGTNVSLQESSTDVIINAVDAQQLSWNGTTRVLSLTNSASVTIPETTLAFLDSGTVKWTGTTTKTATSPMRISGNPATQPGAGDEGFNFTSTDNSVIMTNPSAGVINFSVPNIASYYNNDSSASGAVTLAANTNSSVTHFTGTLSANRVVTLSSAGAAVGSEIKISTIGATFGAYNISVKDGPSNSTLNTTTIETSFLYKFNGTNWVQFS